MLHKPEDKTHADANSQANSSSRNCHVAGSQEVLLKIIPVVLTGPNMTFSTFALLDEASTVSLIETEIATKLGLDGPVQPLKIQWTNDQYNEQSQSQTVSLSIKGIQSGCVNHSLYDVLEPWMDYLCQFKR